MNKNNIKEATGATITEKELLKEELIYNITHYGAAADEEPVENTIAINRAILEAHQIGGGTVVVPEGEFKCYTIVLRSNVNLYLSKGAVLRAARTDIRKAYEVQEGEGGNYLEPEVSPYAGLQDHGHSYFANSLIYAADAENIMLYGSGRIDGSYVDENGYLRYALMGGDPPEGEYRNEPGHRGEWFGNKAIAFLRCKNVVFKDFSLVIGGHFAIITEGVSNMLVENILVDTTRDAFDIDCCENVTVKYSTFNSLTDDALVMKASYGAGIFMPLKNVLIEDCCVSGYDAGSVYAGEYTCDKLIATDRCGPTARVKLGTESTCGYEQVTIRRVEFKRSRGFALEAVDGADLKDIIFIDCIMEDVSSSPIFIRIGDRGRFPVTGNSKEELIVAEESNVRLDNRNWVLPNNDSYTKYPAKRYTPSYVKDYEVSIDGKSSFKIVNPENPTRLNPANFIEEDGVFYGFKFDENLKRYVIDRARVINKEELPIYANANGSEKIALIENVYIDNVTVKNADPRYPVIIMGLEDSHVKNVSLNNIDIEYRGGLTMEHAVEQRQLNTNWEYSQFGTAPSIQVLPWLVNTFFLKDEGLLPRVKWDEAANTWIDAPFNVPELPGVYPEPSNWGILPAYGLYARHVDGLLLNNVRLNWIVEDTRPMIVLDDVADVSLIDVTGSIAKNTAHVVTVSNKFKRPTNLEYVPDYPYHETRVERLTISNSDGAKLVTEEVFVDAPAPGTPKDSLFIYPTVAIPENGYSFKVPTDEYALPLTVYRPFFVPVKTQRVRVGEEVIFKVAVRYPAYEAACKEAEGHIYNEIIRKREYTVSGKSVPAIIITPVKLPIGAKYDSETKTFSWTARMRGEYEAVFGATDADEILSVKELKVKIIIN